MIRNPSRRFFPKEVAVLFGLFILNAVLMFVVGLSVGKTWQSRRPQQASAAKPVSQASMGLVPPPLPAWTPDKWKSTVSTRSPVPPVSGSEKKEITLSPVAEKLSQVDVISFPKGQFTVQVGSYLSEPEANERIEELKKFGFPHAYFSAKELGDPKMVWYRVWLGYFSTVESARRSGEWLQKRGEVKSFLVRKNEPNG